MCIHLEVRKFFTSVYDKRVNFISIVIITSKLKIFNKNYKGLGTTEKEKKQEETQTGR